MSFIPFMRTLDASFFTRLVLFGGICYYACKFMNDFGPKRVLVKQEGPSSPNRFSKTFGQEKQLDEILSQLSKDEENNNLNEESELQS